MNEDEDYTENKQLTYRPTDRINDRPTDQMISEHIDKLGGVRRDGIGYSAKACDIKDK